MKAIRSGDHLFLVGSDMLAWTRGAIFFATWVALGWVGWHYLTSGRSELNCRRIEPTVVNCTFTDRGLFHKEIIELPNNQLEQADVLQKLFDISSESPMWQALQLKPANQLKCFSYRGFGKDLKWALYGESQAQIGLLTRDGQLIPMNPAHLLGRRPHDYVREINRFLPDAPSNGEKNNYRELQIRDRLNLGIVLLVSVILLPAATFSSCCLLIWLMYFFTLDILVVWHVDRQHDGLTDMRLKPYFWRRTHYSLTDVFAACKARKLSSSGHGFMLMLRRYRHSPHKLVRETGLSRKAAQRLEARVNEFLELGYASLEDNPPLHGQPNCP